MALLVFEEALGIGAKYAAPYLMDLAMNVGQMGAIGGAALSAGRSSSSFSDNNLEDNSLRARILRRNFDPDVVAAIANHVRVPPPPPGPTPVVTDANGNYVSGGSVSSNSVRVNRTREELDAGISDEEFKRLIDQERNLIANFFGTTVETVAAIPELNMLALPAVTGVGPIFSRTVGQRAARDMLNRMNYEDELLRLSRGPLAQAMTEAKLDAEMKSGVPISNQAFAGMIHNSGVSASRIVQAWQRISGSIGNNPATRAVFRKWMADRLLPGMAGSGLTYVLEQIRNQIGSDASMPGTTVPQEGRNSSEDRTVSVEEAQRLLLDHEIARALDGIDIGDEASHLKGSTSWKDRLLPMPGSVHWTVNPTDNNGSAGSFLPTGALRSAFPEEIPRSSPVESRVFDEKLRGNFYTTRQNVPEANRRKTAIPITQVNFPTIQPPNEETLSVPGGRLVVPKNPSSEGLGLRGVRQKPYFIADHERAREMDGMVTSAYDTTMVPALPSSVGATTSSKSELYTGPNAGYKGRLDYNPNVVGIGSDEINTEEQIIEQSIMHDESRQTQRLPGQMDTREDASLPRFVPPAEATNPVFRNAEKQQPLAPLQGVSLFKNH